MRDQSESTPQPDPTAFDPDGALRETFAQLIQPRERQILEALCAALLELTREAPVVCAAIPGGDRRGDLQSAAAELRFLGAYLAFAGSPEDEPLPRAEARLADEAERLAVQVREAAEAMETALAAVR